MGTSTHIFNVADEDGQTFFFRFYDPRVLRAFLPTCSPSQLTDFFGPVRAMIVESEGGEELQVIQWGRAGWRCGCWRWNDLMTGSVTLERPHQDEKEDLNHRGH